MKSSFRVSLPRIAALALVSSSLIPSLATAQVTTGFSQTDAGPYDYNSTGNWFGGTINGIWDVSNTITAAQTVTFDDNTSLTTGLDFRYTGTHNLTLRSDDTGPYTLTLGGNINVDTASANRTVTIGSSTANQALNIDLGGATRTFSVGGIANSSSARTLTLQNNVSNGGLLLNGGGVVNLNGNTNTLSSLRIQNSALRLNGNGGANTVTTIDGALTIDGAASSVASNLEHFGGIATITLTPSGSRNTALSASTLVRENSGVAFFRGNNLGGTLGANGVSNITFANAPDLVGGGGSAGSTNISILGWAVGSTTAAGNANTFVTYDAINGIRALNTSTEFENYAADYTGAVTGTANSNTRIASGTVTLTGNNTVNSLFMGESGVATLAGDGGTLTVTSGAVFMHTGSTTISANLNFGTQEGVIGYIQGVSTTISGGIAGSGGLTLYQAQSNTSWNSAGTGVLLTGAATFTGDFTVNSRAQVSHSDFLAHGSRTGNVVVNGMLTLSGNGTDSRGYTMNGLYGNGRLSKGSSGEGLFRIGDNNANGNFTGTITDGGTTALEKIGTGTQILTGANAWAGATRILGGTLDVTQLANGGQNSGIGRSSSVAANLVLNGGTLKYSGVAASTDRLFTIGTLGGALNASGSGAVNFNATGAIVSAEAANRAGTRSVGSNIVTSVTNFANLAVGTRVTGAGITTGTTITAIDTVNGTITLSANATTNSSANMSFATDRTLALSGDNIGDNTIAGILANSSTGGVLGVTKSGAGTWTLAGASTYTGATTVNAGVLALGASDRISNSSNLVLAGGTFATRGFSETLGTLTLSASSSIDLGSGASTLVFADSNLASWSPSVSLSILNFDIGTDSVRFGSTGSALSPDQLARIIINGTHYASIDGLGYLGLGAAIPEPSTFGFFAGAAILVVAGSRRQRRTAL